MHTKCILIFAFLIQFSRLSWCSKDTTPLDTSDSLHGKQLLNYTQHIIHTTLNNIVSIFNDSIAAQTLENRNTAAVENTYKANQPTNCCNQNNWCRDWLEYYKNLINKIIDDYNKIQSNVVSDCLNSDKWIECKLCVDYKTNTRKVLAIPKLIADKTGNWATANATCARLGGRLLKVDYATQVCLETFYPQLNTTVIWTSGQADTSGSLKWYDGELIANSAYKHWNPNQPDNTGGNENCVDLSQNCCGWSAWFWNDQPCSDVYFVICEFDP